MLKLVGPEVLRRPIKLADVQDMRMSLRAWALQYMEGAWNGGLPPCVEWGSAARLAGCMRVSWACVGGGG